MDRKTKHRILGMLVVIGLVIILLPLFQSKKEIGSTTTVAIAPPFPEQSILVTSNKVEPTQDLPIQASNTAQTQINFSNPSVDHSNEVKQQPDEAINVIHPPVIQAITPPSQRPSSSVAQSPKEVTKIQTIETTITQPKVSIKNANSVSENKKMISTKKNFSSAMIKPRIISSPKHLDDDGLVQIKSAVWVIQIGSYKNKTHALHMVNQLRENGYRAFIQQISTSLDEHTRVFVGPENKRSSAQALANKLQSEMHIQGIVISYKPLTL